MKYTLNYFIRKFSGIPRKKWTTGRYTRGNKRCALGHCGNIEDNDTLQSVSLDRLLSWNAVGVNDGIERFKYLGKDPRTRVLRALKLIKKGKSL